jgi:hypothetical protein
MYLSKVATGNNPKYNRIVRHAIFSNITFKPFYQTMQDYKSTNEHSP